MKWIGITGGIASGKSTVSNLLRQRGYPVVDADEIAREVVKVGSPGFQSVLSHFGTQVLDGHGEIDRKKLGAMVFADPALLGKLESILHPLIKEEAARRRRNLEQRGEKFAFYDVPLLFEKKLQENFDLIIVVSASLDTQRSRMKDRDRLKPEEIEKRLRAQIPVPLKESGADFVIRNEGSIKELESRVAEMLNFVQAQSG